MSKKLGIMDRHFQEYNLMRDIRVYSEMESDTIDVQYIDSTLHYPENRANIFAQFHISMKSHDEHEASSDNDIHTRNIVVLAGYEPGRK